MFGGLRADRKAQLALMDAMVFFAFAVIASSMLIMSVSTHNSQSNELLWDVDVSSILETFLCSSISEEVVLDGSQTLTVPADTLVLDVLVLLVSIESEGGASSGCVRIERVLERMLEALEPQSCDLFLVIRSADVQGLQTIIPHAPPESRFQHAASATIPAYDGSLIVASLILQPSSLPEARDVAVRDAYLRFGVLFAL